MLVVMVCSFSSTFRICCKVTPTFTTTGFETLEKWENMKILFNGIKKFHSHQGLACHSSDNWWGGVQQVLPHCSHFPHCSHLQFCSPNFDLLRPNWQKWKGGRIWKLPWSLQVGVTSREEGVLSGANWTWFAYKKTGYFYSNPFYVIPVIQWM